MGARDRSAPPSLAADAPRARLRLAPWLPPSALAAAVAATAAFTPDAGEAATLALFGLLAAGVLGALAFAVADGVRLGVASLAAAAALVGLPHVGVLRSAVVVALLAAAVVLLGARALGQRPSLATWLALAAAAQLVARGELLLLGLGRPARWAELVALPLAAGLALAALAATGRQGARRAGAAALVAFAAGPGWGIAGVAALALAAGAVRVAEARNRAVADLAAALLPAAALLASDEPRWLAIALAGLGVAALAPGPSVAAAARGALALLVAGATLAATLPWRRPAPAAAFLGALVGRPAPVVDRPVEGHAVVLTAAQPRLELELSGRAIRAVTIDSYLVESVALPCGTRLARVEVAAPGGSLAFDLEVGRDSAEWAAERPDVAAALACPAPPAWTSWIPAAGRFFGHHYRARRAVALPLAATRLVLERDPALPEATALALFEVATGR